MTRRALVTGAGGPVGEAIATALLRDGWAVVASMRRRRAATIARLQAQGAEVAFHALPDDSAQWARAAGGCDALVVAAHLQAATAALQNAAVECGRVVAFSSNNVVADAGAPSYVALAAAEAALRARFADAAIVRPTLIYGDPRLPTLTRLMRLAQRWPVLPMPGSGRALVQPVFHRDLAALAAGLAAADAPGGVFAAGGPDVLSMRDLYRAVTDALGVSRLILPTPRPALALATALRVLTREQAARADVDRIAAPQDALPLSLTPRTTLAEGLAAHVSALRAELPGGG